MSYSGYLISEESRSLLKKLFPPKYPDFIGHHITYKFGVAKDSPEPPVAESIVVIGHVAVDGVEAFLVEIDGSIYRPSGGKYHITWSIDKSLGRKPVDSNKIIDQAVLLDKEIPIKAEPKIFL
jgi:hypothetical protein